MNQQEAMELWGKDIVDSKGYYTREFREEHPFEYKILIADRVEDVKYDIWKQMLKELDKSGLAKKIRLHWQDAIRSSDDLTILLGFGSLDIDASINKAVQEKIVELYKETKNGDTCTE